MSTSQPLICMRKPGNEWVGMFTCTYTRGPSYMTLEREALLLMHVYRNKINVCKERLWGCDQGCEYVCWYSPFWISKVELWHSSMEAIANNSGFQSFGTTYSHWLWVKNSTVWASHRPLKDSMKVYNECSHSWVCRRERVCRGNWQSRAAITWNTWNWIRYAKMRMWRGLLLKYCFSWLHLITYRPNKGEMGCKRCFWQCHHNPQRGKQGVQIPFDSSKEEGLLDIGLCSWNAIR